MDSRAGAGAAAAVPYCAEQSRGAAASPCCCVWGTPTSISLPLGTPPSNWCQIGAPTAAPPAPCCCRHLLQVVATAVTLPVSVGLVVLLVWNAYLFLRNQTTIEYHEGEGSGFGWVGWWVGWAGWVGGCGGLGWEDGWVGGCGGVGWEDGRAGGSREEDSRVPIATGDSRNCALPPCPWPPLPDSPAGVVAQYLSGAGSPSSSGGGGGGRHPFDLGWHDNMHAVCGGSPACWPLPGRAAAEGDGLSFPTPWGQRGKL